MMKTLFQPVINKPIPWTVDFRPTVNKPIPWTVDFRPTVNKTSPYKTIVNNPKKD